MDGTVNIYMRPIEGVTVTIDLDSIKIVGFLDRIKVPAPKGDGTDYRGSQQSPPFSPSLNRITSVQPDGPSFTLSGHLVRWGSWEFHLGFDVRAGTIISLASVLDVDKGNFRRVLYRGYILELFVPYMDLTEEWYYRTFFDAGEYGLGLSAVPLQPSTDCPANAVFLDAYLAAHDGSPVKMSNVFCIFERYAGDILWQHTEVGIPGKVITEVRPEVSLVVRMVSTVANYDYIVDWEFTQSGSIRLKVQTYHICVVCCLWLVLVNLILVGLTGLLKVRGSVYTHMDQISDEEYGILVAENTIGSRHDHFLTYHLDLDIDGEANSFLKLTLQMTKVDAQESPRRSYWKVISEKAKTESDARIRLGLDQAELLFVNPSKRTRVGNTIGYRPTASRILC
ncbi:hypothetical protein SAY86_021321 [Trapa natans]|uniref:Amine oxidase n=1 Tax=Trapa natans TaxID=22666 RepID=A0AAN7M9K1_TRANT|nr:hypothetical protein SAY86_021321 [Trapa natans]